MGLFDRFKRRVKEVSDEFDTDELTVEEDSVEGQQLASAKIQTEEGTLASTEKQFDSVDNVIQTDEDDWEVFEDDEKAVLQFKTQMTTGKNSTRRKTIFHSNLPVRKKRLQKEQKQLEKAKKPMRNP